MENHKEINLDDAIKLINESKSELIEEIVDELSFFKEKIADKIILYSGDTTLENLIVGSDIIIINGNLNITKVISDCHGADYSLLIVLGNVTCKNIITLSSIFIIGDLSVENVILGDSLCDYSLVVDGNIKTKTILDYGHCIISSQKITAENIYSFNSVEDENGNIEQNMTRDELIDEITYIDDNEKFESREKTIAYIKSGGEVFKIS